MTDDHATLAARVAELDRRLATVERRHAQWHSAFMVMRQAAIGLANAVSHAAGLPGVKVDKTPKIE